MKMIIKTLKIISISIVFLIIIGVIYEQISRMLEKRQIVLNEKNQSGLDNHKLFYKKKGTGSPTIIFESGVPSTHDVWDEIQKELSAYTTTISYDRAGLQFSDRGPKAKTSINISDDLAVLLKNENLPKPYIIVGHSFASVSLTPFIQNHRDDIEGIVFVDPVHPNLIYNASDSLKKLITPAFRPSQSILTLANNLGIIRLLTGDPHIYRSIKSGGLMDEIDFSLHEISRSSELGSFSDLPISIISAGAQDVFDANLNEDYERQMVQNYWNSLHEDMIKMSSNTKVIKAEKSGHYIMKTEPNIIIGEVAQLIKQHQTLNEQL